MKAKQGLVGTIALALLIATPSAFATNLTKACKSDLKKFGCQAKSDAEAHECLEKNEKEGNKSEGFSKSCYKAHEAYEKKMGKSEKEEHHEHSEANESH